MYASIRVCAHHFSAGADAGADNVFDTTWMWARSSVDGDTCYYYWPATDHLVEPTCVWKFTHELSDETRYGDDPRAFWDDWDEDRPGDLAEPTPFSKSFEAFVIGKTSGWTWLYSEQKHVPEGPTLFESEIQAQLVNQGLWGG